MIKTMWLSRRSILRCLFATAVSLPAVRRRAHARDAPIVELEIETDGDFLAFVPDELTCPAGAHVRLTFHHAGVLLNQEHNWVLVKPGTQAAIEKAGASAGEVHGWVPPNDPRVLAATPLVSPGESTVIEFTAPSRGDYPFLCTFPGHGEVMHGILHVT